MFLTMSVIGLAYGRKNDAGVELANKRELEVIEKMKSLRDKGFSYHKIADVLNSMKIPTKTRKGLWRGKTVWQVLLKVKKFGHLFSSLISLHFFSSRLPGYLMNLEY